MQKVFAVDAAQPDAADQSLVAGDDHGRELLVEQLVGPLALEQVQVDGGQLVDPERRQIRLDIAAQIGRLTNGQPSTGLIAPDADLAHQRRVLRVGVQRLANQLVGDVGTVELRGVDVVDAPFDNAAQHRDRLVMIARRAHHTRTRQLHGAKANAGDRHLNGFPGGPPPRLALSLGDTLAGLFGAQGAMAALYRRSVTGRGQVVDVALTEACLAIQESTIPDYVVGGVVRGPSGTRLDGIAPSNITAAPTDPGW